MHRSSLLWCFALMCAYTIARIADLQTGKIYMCWTLLSSIITLDRCMAGVRAVCYHLLYEIFNMSHVEATPPDHHHHHHTHKCRVLLSAHANPRPLWLDLLMQMKTGALNTELLIAPTFRTPVGLVSALRRRIWSNASTQIISLHLLLLRLTWRRQLKVDGRPG